MPPVAVSPAESRHGRAWPSGRRTGDKCQGGAAATAPPGVSPAESDRIQANPTFETVCRGGFIANAICDQTSRGSDGAGFPSYAKAPVFWVHTRFSARARKTAPGAGALPVSSRSPAESKRGPAWPRGRRRQGGCQGGAAATALPGGKMKTPGGGPPGALDQTDERLKRRRWRVPGCCQRSRS
jgi:hypothetical protein